MRAVVDASVAAKWYFPEPGREAADSILGESAEGELELFAPDLLECEFANVLWKKLQRGECDAAVLGEILELWETDRPSLIASQLLSRRALDLALQLGHPVYDCLYLSAAIEHEAMLATADSRLARLARGLVARVRLVA